ncbi:SDR family oxidoreductase [Ramlibacter sp. RBP-2]|uniref:SDR family oxidoreductase n=1 Tax=Ramlibacter lithotrophicus TaxID=2606681 RepID=A0A7X6I688_9BURK|nr:SDR family NAD(P)-dependent oxidoreductase [Ramlibacter lithotrophicus]NKE66111.1 SDR family oxidoreductase [Ramlibacter lithotrophicus]
MGISTTTSSPGPGSSPLGVLVVGASGALGQAICDRLADDGYHLLVTYRNNSAATEALQPRLADRVTVSTVQLDLTDEDSVAAARGFVETRGMPLHGVVFASGVNIEQPWVADASMAQWRAVVETELLGFAALAHHFIPLLRAAGGGAVVCVSTFANYAHQLGDALSSVPKAGVESLMRSIALEYGRYGVRANAVAPGIINAGLGAEFQRKFHTPEAWEGIRKKVPMRRFGEADDIARAVRFLISPDSGYITGNTLIVDGGMHL